jgi:hypothetical protein
MSLYSGRTSGNVFQVELFPTLFQSMKDVLQIEVKVLGLVDLFSVHFLHMPDAAHISGPL